MAVSITDVRQHTQHVFGIRPCLWQVKVAQALLKGDKDVLCTAGTGMGKTLGFWIPLLFRPESMQIVITPLNLLGRQNTLSLAKAGIKAISIDAETATSANFAVSLSPPFGTECITLTYYYLGHQSISLLGHSGQPRAAYEARWRIRAHAQRSTIHVMSNQHHH